MASNSFFSVSWHPLRTLDLPRALLPELPRYKETVRCGAIGEEVEGHRKISADANQDCAFVEYALFLKPILDFEKSTE